MAVKGSYAPYRRRLIVRSRALRREPTEAETKLWFGFLRQLPAKFTRQKPLGNYIADFYCASHRLVVEVDGDSHFTAAGETYDAIRDAKLLQQGLCVIRFTNEDVMQRFEGVCLRISAVLEQPKPNPSLAYGSRPP
jgi:very-short-patch-repair endonuclease